jgi:hypothetical protein
MFGDLKDFPVTDLLPVLSGRSGCLTIQQPRESRIYLHLNRITHLEAPGLPAHDTWAARERLYHILGHAHEGTFAFTNLPLAQIPQTVCWPIEAILLTALSQSDILAEYGDMLPDPQTVFTVTGQDPNDLNHDLRMRFQAIAPFLDGQLSAHAVAHRLGGDEVEILYTLARLRILGYVRPMRRCLEAPLAAPVVAVAAPATRTPLLRRLAGFLRAATT